MSFPLVKNSNDTKAGPSASIWAPFNTADFIRNPELGYHVFDDFIGGAGPYLSFEETNSTVVGLADFLGGAARIATSTTDDNTGSIYLGGVLGGAGGTVASDAAAGGSGFVISSTAANQAMLGFECRVRISSVTATRADLFFGLADPNNLDVTQTPVTGAGVIVDESALGFFRPTGTPADFDFIYNEASQIQADFAQDILAGNTGGNTTVLAADTWIKLGFVFDPNSNLRSDGTNLDRITFYVNGEPFGGTSIIDQVDLEAATFPDDAGMVPVISGTTDGTTSINIDVDWMRCAQFRI